MNITKQTDEKPLFPDMLWSRPENKNKAGKLLIIGGNLHDIAKIAGAAALAQKAGAGTVRIVLPDCVKKLVGSRVNVFYAPSNPSGGFARASLGVWLEHAHWADMVLLPGELGRNSESALVLEGFLQKYIGLLTITRDAIDLLQQKNTLLQRDSTLILATIPQLQKMLAHKGILIKVGSPLQTIASQLVDSITAPCIVTLHNQHLVVVANSQISITPTKSEHWRLPIATSTTVWLMQFPNKPFEAITTAVFESQK